MTVEGKVAKILGKGEVVLNRGRSHGVRQGMLFEIFAPEGEEVWDPDTGETLGTVEDVKAQAEVTEVKERLAGARLQNNTAPPLGGGARGSGAQTPGRPWVPARTSRHRPRSQRSRSGSPSPDYKTRRLRRSGR